jgi:hypothetical protein
MATKYQVTELDKVVEQVKGFSEWTNEDQLEHQLRFQEESHKKALERMAVKNAELYTDNVLLKREIEELKKPNHYEMANELLMRDIEVLKTKVKKGKDLISKLQSELKELKIKASSKSMAHICMQEDADTYYIQLEEYRKLKSALFPLIERLWAIDSGDPLQIIKGEKKEIINTIAYRIANEWID